MLHGAPLSWDFYNTLLSYSHEYKLLVFRYTYTRKSFPLILSNESLDEQKRKLYRIGIDPQNLIERIVLYHKFYTDYPDLESELVWWEM
jgi:hypothetical protein